MSHRAAVVAWSSALTVLVLALPEARGEVICQTGFDDGLPKGWSVVDGGTSGPTWTSRAS